MEEAKVIFILNGEDLAIQCSKKNKMRDICQKYASKIYKNMNSFIFLYGGSELNFELTFEKQATPFDLINNEMKVLVYEGKNGNIICPKCGEVMKLNKEILDEIILSNKEIRDSINGINLQIENIIKTSLMSPINNQLKNINKMLYMINEDIKKNNEKIKSFLNDINSIKSETKILDKEPIKEKNIKELINPSIIGKKRQNNNRILFANIKSNDIIKNVFSYLDETVKLKAIKYNKYLQNKTDINLNHYKFLSGKYIIYEKDGKGKEYDGNTNNLIYEGGFLHGERNGKGKEYNYDGQLIFEGEYLNGKRNGKGKEYNFKNQLKFKGEYLNGNKWEGKIYDQLNNIEYELKDGRGFIK